MEQTAKTGHWATTLLLNVCRLLLAVAFVFSGFVKAVDPLGTQYKIQDYLEALGLAQYVGDWLTLAASLSLSALEFCLGVFLLFAIRRRQVSRMVLAFMAVMTVVTLWLAVANPVKDCGCFGDAVKLTNWQTLWKNVVLLTAAAVVAAWPLRMTRFISKTNQGIVINFTVLFVIGVSLWSLYRLPMFDFRPYHVGANIVKSMEIPEGAKKPKFRTTYIMEKNGERREFALEDYPDSTWTYVDARTELIEKGYEPPIQDLSIVERSTGDDITQQVLTHKGYTFLLVSPHLEYADDSDFGDIDRIYEYAQDNGYPFYCLTASSDKGIEQWRNITGAEYPFCTTDATTLKTIIRSNPGLLLLRDGVVVRKWSHNDLPAADDFKGDGNQAGTDQKLDKLAIGQLPEDRVSVKITMLLLGYVLPLVLLTLADRLWQWTRWLKVDRWRRRKNAETGAENEENQSNNK